MTVILPPVPAYNLPEGARRIEKSVSIRGAGWVGQRGEWINVNVVAKTLSDRPDLIQIGDLYYAYEDLLDAILKIRVPLPEPPTTELEP